MMNSKGGECNLVDRISKLPEEILVTIVSLLPLKEAGATSILSKRWQYVWASTVTLDFDPKHELGEHYCRLLRVEPEQKDLLRQRYVDWVNTVVEQHRGPVIEQFRAYFDIDGHFTSSIDKWIQFAMNKRVQILELVFCNELRSNYKDVYPFPVQLLGLQNDSTLKLNPTHSDISSLHSSGYNLDFPSSELGEDKGRAAKCSPHPNLKVVEVLGYRAHPRVGEHVMHLIKNVAALEKIIIDPVRRWVCILLDQILTKGLGEFKRSKRKCKEELMLCST